MLSALTHRNQARDQFCVCVTVLKEFGWPAVIDGLTVTLVGFNNGRPGGMALFAHPRQIVALSLCGEPRRVRAPAAAAVCFRTKASGRRVRLVPAGASRPLLLGKPAFLACGVRDNESPGAPLKT